MSQSSTKLLPAPIAFLKLFSENTKQFAAFTKADISQLYSGSILGVLWALLFPLIQLSIYLLLYAVIFKVRPVEMTSTRYTIFVMSGLLPVLFFGQALSIGLSCISSKKLFLLNSILPPELIVFSSVALAQIGPFIGIILVFVGSTFLSFTSISLTPLLILSWLLLMMGLFGIALILSLINLVAKDLQHSITLFIMVATVLSPFAYTESMVPSSLRLILYLNPLSYFIKMFQDIVVWGTIPKAEHFLPSFMITTVCYLAGTVFFRRAKYAFFDYI